METNYTDDANKLELDVAISMFKSTLARAGKKEIQRCQSRLDYNNKRQQYLQARGIQE